MKISPDMVPLFNFSFYLGYFSSLYDPWT